MKKILISLVLVFTWYNGNLKAEIQLPALISDHMVLKQKSSTPLWGTEIPRTQVTVETSWNNKKYTTTTDEQGNWMLSVQTPQAGGPYVIRFSGTNKIEIQDVWIGEVWLSSGQSNMVFEMRSDVHAEKYIPLANNPQIRLFKIEKQKNYKIMRTFPDSTTWRICTPESVKKFSAMTYYFANELQKKLNVPVGVINASWGGSPIEAWIPTAIIKSDTILQRSVTRWEGWKRSYKRDTLKYAKEEAAYQKDESLKKPELPRSMYMMKRKHRQYGVLYNGMIAPCTPYALSGILWYQGTSNVGYADEYERQLNALITSWRDTFKCQDLPVIVGQLTAYRYDPEKAYVLREAQLNQRKLPDTYVFCSMDHGDLKDVHPTNKQPYGQRFAYLALNKVYGMKDVACMCPSLKDAKIEKGQIVISFNDGEGLYIKGDIQENLFIAGEDGDFVPAKAKITNGKLVVYFPKELRPTQVRYLYNNTGTVNLYNKYNLPAFPFRVSL